MEWRLVRERVVGHMVGPSCAHANPSAERIETENQPRNAAARGTRRRHSEGGCDARSKPSARSSRRTPTGPGRRRTIPSAAHDASRRRALRDAGKPASPGGLAPGRSRAKAHQRQRHADKADEPHRALMKGAVGSASSQRDGHARDPCDRLCGDGQRAQCGGAEASMRGTPRGRRGDRASPRV